MEEYTPESQESNSEDLKRWFQDNLRIIISVAIVVVIAGGIYSYSRRADVATLSTDQSASQTTDSNNTDSQAQASDTSKAAVSSATTSQETESSFVETAGKGASLTVLARTATANYLEKNPDSTLTKEHKIYIEDFLRKSVAKKGVRVGTSVEFSKELIQKAIAQSKNLNERQLKNLQKYSSRVASL